MGKEGDKRDKRSSSPGSEKSDSERKKPKADEKEEGHRTKDSKDSKGKDSKDSKKPNKKERPKFKDDEPGREYECVLCDCKFFTLGQHAIHIESFQHRKRVIQKAATKAYGKAPDYHGGGPGTELPRGLSGKRVVHCKVCNVFTNSPKQLAEHLGGGRHKMLCFKLNVPITTIEPSPDDVHTLEATRLEGSKLVCKHCSVELNSKQQYEEHMKSKNHQLRLSNKPLRPLRKIRRELRPFYKSTKKEQEEGPGAKKPKEEHGDGKKKRGREGEEEGGDKEEAGKEECSKDKARKKYKFNLLDDLNEMPSLRNEITFANCEKRPKKPKPAAFMCDICEVFCKSAYELNEHLTSEEHSVQLHDLLAGDQPAKDNKRARDNNSSPGNGDGKSTQGEEPSKEKKLAPAVYCEVCQLMLPSLGAKREHENSKKHKFLQELRKGVKTEPAPAPSKDKEKEETPAAPAKVLHCSTCREDVETDMKEHLRSKKHRFLAELKPGSERQQPEEGGPSSVRKRNRPPREGEKRWQPEVPELVALAVERRALQAELAKRRQEIEVQQRLVDELREEQRLEEEKAELRRMIAECRELIEERNRRTSPQQAASSARSRSAKSVQWHQSLNEEREFHRRPRGSPPPQSNYETPRSMWEGEIPLLGPPLEYADRGGPNGRSEERPYDGRSGTFPPFEPALASWRPEPREGRISPSHLKQEPLPWLPEPREGRMSPSGHGPGPSSWLPEPREERMSSLKHEPGPSPWQQETRSSPLRHGPGPLSWQPNGKEERMSPPQHAEPPVWAGNPNWAAPSAFLQEQPPQNDWQRPVLSTPWQEPQGGGFFGGARPAEPSPWLQPPPTSWGSTENVRIPGLDFV